MTNVIDQLPATVRIGPFDFGLEKWPLLEATAASRWGECDKALLKIRVQERFPTNHKAVDTLLHEICHAIYWAFNIMDEDGEERTVQAMSTGWTSVFRDNPWLSGWIKEALA